MPDEPHLAGNPVLSVWQTDIIYYGFDLADYLRHEFRLRDRASEPKAVRPIRFWDVDRFQSIRRSRGPYVFDNSKGNTVSPFVPGELMAAHAGLQVGKVGDALGNVLYEGLYEPGLDPESLYEAQLENRIGHAPLDFRVGAAC